MPLDHRKFRGLPEAMGAILPALPLTRPGEGLFGAWPTAPVRVKAMAPYRGDPALAETISQTRPTGLPLIPLPCMASCGGGIFSRVRRPSPPGGSPDRRMPPGNGQHSMSGMLANRRERPRPAIDAAE